jgi:hypothetical protein
MLARGRLLTVEFADSEADIPQDLWRECFPPPLEGRWWYAALESSGLGNQFTFLYAVVRDNGRPVGIAPLFTMHVDIGLVAPPLLRPLCSLLAAIAPSLTRPRILFVGSPCADEGTVGLLPGVDRAAAFRLLQDAIERKAEELSAAMIVWKDFPQSYAPEFDRLARECGLFALTSFPGAVADIPGARKENYLATLRSPRRTNLKRKLRRSAESFDAAVEIVREPDAATLGVLCGLFRQTRDRGAIKFEHLDYAFFEAIQRQDVAYFLILRDKSSCETVAFMLCFVVGDRVINKYIGLDYSRPRNWSLLFRLWDAAVDFAVACGATSIQSGQTGYASKILQGHRLVPLTNYCKHRNRLLHALCARLARSVSWRTLDRDLADYLRAHPSADMSRPR